MLHEYVYLFNNQCVEIILNKYITLNIICLGKIWNINSEVTYYETSEIRNNLLIHWGDLAGKNSRLKDGS